MSYKFITPAFATREAVLLNSRKYTVGKERRMRHLRHCDWCMRKSGRSCSIEPIEHILRLGNVDKESHASGEFYTISSHGREERQS